MPAASPVPGCLPPGRRLDSLLRQPPPPPALRCLSCCPPRSSRLSSNMTSSRDLVLWRGWGHSVPFGGPEPLERNGHVAGRCPL